MHFDSHEICMLSLQYIYLILLGNFTLDTIEGDNHSIVIIGE